jgi:hypothetical protein
MHTSIIVIISVPIRWWSWWGSIFHLLRGSPFRQRFTWLATQSTWNPLRRPSNSSFLTHNPSHFPLQNSSPTILQLPSLHTRKPIRKNRNVAPKQKIFWPTIDTPVKSSKLQTLKRPLIVVTDTNKNHPKYVQKILQNV